MAESNLQDKGSNEYSQESLMPMNMNNSLALDEGGMLHLYDLSGDDHIPVPSAQRKASDDLMSMASIETQPPINYNGFGSNVYQPTDYAYEPEKQFNSYGGYYNGCYGLDNSWPYNCSSAVENMQLMNSQLSLDSQSSPYDNGRRSEESEMGRLSSQDDSLNQEPLFSNQPSLMELATNKVVAVNPIILVDKVERSLIVQWHENGIRREQRISYKKYGNAKAQQRAESLIAKLMAGSTFDQLYPEKGPPILTIFENVGDYKVSLTRDRIKREWKVDWVNANGGKMRARWSCKKVGNEEAKKRAEAFANSLLQGKFNPRLLHKATGTRLSRNDMKYNIVVDEEDPNKHHLYPKNPRAGGRGHSKQMGDNMKRAANQDGKCKKSTKTANKKKKDMMDYFAAMGNRPNEYLRYPPGGPLNAFYPMYPSECESNGSALGHSYDSFPGMCGDPMNPNWQSWNSSAQNLDYSGDWDYSEGPMEYGQCNQMYDVSQPSYMEQMEWMRNGCMMEWMRSRADAPMSARELAEEPANDPKNSNNQMYPYYGNDSNVCYTDSVVPSELGLSGSYYDVNFMGNNQQNSQSQCTYLGSSWAENESKNAENNQPTNNLVTKANGDVSVNNKTGSAHNFGGETETLSGIKPTEASMETELDLRRAPTIIPIGSFGDMKVADVHANVMKYSDDYHISSLPTSYACDSIEYPPQTVSKSNNNGVADFFKTHVNVPDMQDFYMPCKAPLDPSA